MSFSNNEEYSLCWHYLSSTGCRNSNCRWRHQNIADRFCQEYVHQTRGNEISHYKDPRKALGVPFYQIKQHQDGGVKDQYVLENNQKMDIKDGFEKSIQFGKNLGYWQEYDHINSSPMSIMSPGASDSEGDMVKNDVLDVGKFQQQNSFGFADLYGEVLDVGEFQQRNSFGYADLYGEVKTPRRRMKREWQSDKDLTSSLSPFAKAFVPRKSMMSKDGIRTGLNKKMLDNLSVNTIQQRGNLSCLTENDEVFE